MAHLFIFASLGGWTFTDAFSFITSKDLGAWLALCVGPDVFRILLIDWEMVHRLHAMSHY